MAFGNKKGKAEIAKTEHQELMEKIDSMQKFLEDYTKITVEMQSCVEKSIKFQQEMIEWFGNEIKSIKEKEQYYIEVATTAKAEAEEIATVAESEETVSEPEGPEAVSEPEGPEAVSEPEGPEAVSEPEGPEAVSEPEGPEAVSEPEEPEVVSEPEEIEAVSESEEPEVVSEPEEPETVEEEAAKEEDIKPAPVIEPSVLPKMNEKEKKGLFGGLFKRKKKKEVINNVVEDAPSISEQEDAAKAEEEATLAELKADMTEITPEEEKRLARLSAAPTPYVGSPVKSYPRNPEAAAKAIDELINPDFVHIDIPEPEKTEEEILAENEAIVERYEQLNSEEVQEEMSDYVQDDDVVAKTDDIDDSDEVADETATVEETADTEAEPTTYDNYLFGMPGDLLDLDESAKDAVEESEIEDEEACEEISEETEEEAVVEEIFEETVGEVFEESAETEAEKTVDEEIVENETSESIAAEVVEEIAANPIYKTEEGQKMLSELKSDHEKEAAATERLVDNMYKRHREELMRLCDEINVDYAEFDGYDESMQFPEGEQFEELKELVMAHIREKQTISGLKDRMVNRHTDEDKELCKELGLPYEDFLNGNY